MIDTARPDYGVYLSAPLDTTSAQHFSVEAGLSAPNPQPFDHATANPGAFAPAGFHAPLPTDQPMVPIASGSQHRQPGFGTHSFMPGAASAAPFSSYGEPSGSSAQPRDFAIASSSRHVAQEPAPGSASQVASSSRNTLPPADPSAIPSLAASASNTTVSRKLSKTHTSTSVLYTLFSHIREEDFIALSPAARQEYVENFTPSAKLSTRGSKENSLKQLRSQIQTALRKLDLLPLARPSSNADRPENENAALEKIANVGQRGTLGAFMTDLRIHHSSFSEFELMTPEARKVHVDRYLLNKSRFSSARLTNALKELGLSGTGQ
ncbi:hypothetical protein G3O00_36055 [Burkholderia sp. Ac-20384]|uniref:hypothetical protein n=1 Tax=Burkholderia sp. Ac-20384 TaxID=2703902 RepID=UPI0019802BAA|nr:hypothetical protein [Burkholderia sp. Ac-20384]MBN3828979.1 hypothetical protein [Burkholderia sp. Ac-20384]